MRVLLYRDGGLGLTAYLAQNIGRSGAGAGRLNALHSQLMLNKSLKVLEVGSGYDKALLANYQEAYCIRCGIVGLALALLHDRCHVTLTDLPLAEEILRKNIKDAKPEGKAVFKALDWDQPIPESLASQHWDVILVADCTYNVASALSLVEVLSKLAWNTPDSVIVLAHKKRHDSENYFFELMGAVFEVEDRVCFNSGDQETGILGDIYTFRLAVKRVDVCS